MATKEYFFTSDPTFEITLHETGYDYEKREPVHNTIQTITSPKEIVRMLRQCSLSVTADEALYNGALVRMYDDEKFKGMMFLTPLGITCARILQREACRSCGCFRCKCEQVYPQGWRYYPGDTCQHGMYIGGCGPDLICGACENSGWDE